MEPTGRLTQETRIEADQATVFAFLTDPDRLLRWMGVSASLEPEPGGLYLVDVTGGHVARGEYKEVVPVSRLAYSFGWQDSEAVPPGSSLVEIDLIPQDGGTLLRLTHSGLPADQVAGHAEGWAHYAGRLAAAAAGGEPGADPWIGRRG
ncbi:MAG: SRPBCC family protein [Dongiaceae bacterium]